MTTSSGQPSLVQSMPPTLVEQLADALGAAEARCAEQRINIQPINIQPSLRAAAPYIPPSYINAETAPFLVQPRTFDSSFVGVLAQAPAMLPPPTQLPVAADAVRAFSSFGQPGSGPAEPADHWAEQEDTADLPRFFAPDRQPMPRQLASMSGTTHNLSAATMALGFVIGLALILPAMWLASAGKNTNTSKRVTASASGQTSNQTGGLTMPLMTASSLSSLVPASAFEVAERGGKAPTELERLELAEAAFLEASRRIAVGDYIGARDQLRRAITFGEDRAQALLDALQ
jgi:hypothetical protein